MAQIGRERRGVQMAEELEAIARSDAAAAEVLAQSGSYRQAIYFTLQAMEKLIRARIFRAVNPENDHFRNNQRTHSLSKAISDLIDMAATRELRSLIRSQIEAYVIGGVNYQHLHNNLRYPRYIEAARTFVVLDFSECDYREIMQRLAALRAFLAGLDRL